MHAGAMARDDGVLTLIGIVGLLASGARDLFACGLRGHDTVPIGDGSHLCRRCLRPCSPRRARSMKPDPRRYG